MQAVLYTFTFAHHGRYSSFHHLADYLSDQIIVDGSLRLPAWVPQRVANRLTSRWRELGEYRLRRYYRQPQRRCFHYLYPENTLCQAARWKGPHRLLLTCHQPIPYLEDLRRKGDYPFFRGLTLADMIVVLSPDQVASYQQYVPQAEVVCLPHGVDVEFFQPVPGTEQPQTVLTVGNWLRDYGCWAKVARAVAAVRADVEFVVVANPDTNRQARSQMGACPARVRYLSGLSDIELRDLYRRSTLLFLPLTDAIANNAVLESLAMGLPIVTTDLPATRFYAGDQAAVYFQNAEPDRSIDELLRILADEPRRIRMGQCGRARAVREFAWPRIADEYRLRYRQLLS